MKSGSRDITVKLININCPLGPTQTIVIYLIDAIRSSTPCCLPLSSFMFSHAYGWDIAQVPLTNNQASIQ